MSRSASFAVVAVAMLLAACVGVHYSAKHGEGESLLLDRRVDEAIRVLTEAAREADESGNPRAAVEVRSLLGWAYAEGLKFAEAERETRQAIALAERHGLDPAFHYARLSVVLSKAGDYQGGLASAEQALARTVAKWKGRAGTDERRAVLDYAIAHHGYPPDVEMIKTITMAESAAAVCHVLLGDDRAAVEIGERALAHFESLSLLLTMAPAGERREFYRSKGLAAATLSRAYRDVGDHHKQQDRLAVAKAAFEQSGVTVQGDDLLAAYTAAGRYTTPAAADGFIPDPKYSEAFNRADRLYFDGDYARASDAFRDVVAQAKAAGQADEASRASSQWGWMLAEAGRYAEAVRLLRDATALSPQADFTAVTYARLSAVEARLGSYDKGLADADRALALLVERRQPLFRGKNRDIVIDEAMKHPGLPPDVLLLKAVTAAEGGKTTIHYFRRDYRETIRLGERAMQHYADAAPAVRLAPEREQISYAEGAGWVTLMVGDAYVNLGDIAKGRALVEQSRAWFARARLPFGDAVAEGLIAYSYVLGGDYRKGAEGLKAVMARVEAGGLEELKWHIRATFAEQLLKDARALEAQAPALAAIADPAKGDAVKRELFARYTDKTAALFVLVDRDTASRVGGILASLEAAPDGRTAAVRLTAFARLLKEEAYTNYLGAADNLDSIRARLETDLNKRLFQADKQRIYGDLIQLAVELRGPAAGFEALERAKARGLMDLLATKDLRFRRGDLLAEERALRAEAGAAATAAARRERGLDAGGPMPAPSTPSPETAERYRGILLKITREEPELASFVSPTVPTAAAVQRDLPPDVTLVEYFAGPERLYIWVIERTALSVRAVAVSRADLAAKVTRFRDAITARDRAAQQAPARELYDLLIGPVKTALHGTRLGLVPHDSLHYLPFQALLAGERYLIQDYPLFFAPSAAVLRYAMAKAKPGGERLLAFGNPDLGHPDLDLPYAQAEVDALAALYPSSTVKLRGEATKAAAVQEAGRFDLLHFATHAEFSALDPLYSALRLAPDGAREGEEGRDGRDGRLSAGDIFALDLHPSLVTLSACQTGLGLATSGDEVVGMTRAFIYAGAPSIVASLWSVSDRSTAMLMEAFYRRLKTGPKDEALRQAQLAVLADRSFADPFYWAPFYLTGDWR